MIGRLKSAYNAARAAWRFKKAVPGQSLLTVYVTVSDELLAERDPSVALLVASDAYTAALRATESRMGLA